MSRLLNECLCEIASVTTDMGIRKGLELIDYDNEHLMFRDETGTLVVLPRRIVKAIEFEEIKNEVQKCVPNKDSKGMARKKMVQSIQENRKCQRPNDTSRPHKKAAKG